jgi:hypothetical protein
MCRLLIRSLPQQLLNTLHPALKLALRALLRKNHLEVKNSLVSSELTTA